MLRAVCGIVSATMTVVSCVPSDGRPKRKPDAGASAPVVVRQTGAARSIDAPGSPIASSAAVRRESAPGPRISDSFEDDFERGELGSDWHATSSVWRVQQGRLCGRGARNHPVWLRRRLPENAVIEFEATSQSPDGDIKVEVWGDGKSAARSVSYQDATGYLAIFGGWKNQLHVLARLDEHGSDRRQLRLQQGAQDLRALPVESDRTYQFKIERRDGNTVRWYVDDLEILSFDDPEPLTGPGHEHLGFNDWDVPVCFDNVMITAVGS